MTQATNETATPSQESITTRQANVLRRKILQIVEGGRHFNLDLCWAVHATFEKMVMVVGEPVFIWEAWGYKTWADFVGVELDLYPTTAYAYRHIWERFGVELDGAWDRTQLLGVTKMRILSADTTMNRRNVKSKLKRAAKMTCARLRAEVFGTGLMHHWNLIVGDDDLRVLSEAVQEARGAFGEEGEKMTRGEVLAHIAGEWRRIVKQTQGVREATGAKLSLVS